MIYNDKLLRNEALIPHYQCSKISIGTLKRLLNINENYLREKDTWYIIDKVLKYFKVRNDYRLFTELFFSKFGREIIGLDTVEYEIASIRVTNLHKKNEEKKIGLLSDNFQKSGYNYYLVSELLNPDISDLVCYPEYSLTSLLAFLHDILPKEDYEVSKDFLIRLFISDAFTFQVDRNYHNIGFEIPKIEGISYKQRLRPNVLKAHEEMSKCVVDEEGNSKLKGFKFTKVYDNERILGVDHKNIFAYEKGMIWTPIFPYSPELLFATEEEAVKASEIYDGFDPNLMELYLNFPKESAPYLERLAYDDEYRKILEYFSKNNSQIKLSPRVKEYFENLLEDRRNQFKKILKF